MSIQQTPTGKKKYLWLILPFIVIIGLVTFKIRPTKDSKIDKTQDQELVSDLPTENTFGTKFSPQELADMMKKFGADYIAGECINKGFIQINGNCTVRGVKYDVYNYYAGPSGLDQYNCVNYMKERITPVTDLRCIQFTIKNKDNYEKFIAYLDKIKQDSIAVDKRIYPEYSHYVLNNSVFIEFGYLIGQNGYHIEIDPLDNITNAASNKISEKNETDKDSSIAFVAVNTAHVYKQQYVAEVYEECTLKKGDKVTVLRAENDFVYCDYICGENSPGTGYIQRKDLKFEK